MAIPDRTGCEVRIDDAWQLVPLAEAHAHHRDALKRCPTCHGRVRTQGLYSGDGGVATMHHNAHDGCPRIPKHYAGPPKRHPKALE